MSPLNHTDLLDTDPAGVIDHADKSVTGAKLVDDLEFNTFPITPLTFPDADFEVANKAYVDSKAQAGQLSHTAAAGPALTANQITPTLETSVS